MKGSEKMASLADILGKENVSVEPDVTAEYAVDQMGAQAVAFPRNTREVARVVGYANQEKLALVACGSRTKLGMGNPPKRLDLVVSTSRMNHMLDVDTANLTLTVEAGVKFRDIQARLATEEDRCYLPIDEMREDGDTVICSDRSNSGCFIPIDPPFAGKATIGGIIATGTTGPRRLLYNLPRDSIIGIRLVAPNGDILGAGGKTVKNVSGFDISKLMVGSLGTLGILCEMTIRMLPMPEKMETLLFAFPARSDASAFADRVFETSLLPAAVEIVNQKAYTHLKMNHLPDSGAGGYVAAVALEAFEPAVDRMHKEISELAKDAGCRHEAHLAEQDHGLFWLAMSHLPETLGRQFSGFIGARLIYPLSLRENMMAFGESVFKEAGLGYTLQVHAGSGICLTGLLLDQPKSSTTEKAVTAMKRLLECSRENGGNLVVHSAPTQVKGDLDMWGEISSAFVVMKRLKDQLDPNRMMGPGRFVNGL